MFCDEIYDELAHAVRRVAQQQMAGAGNQRHARARDITFEPSPQRERRHAVLLAPDDQGWYAQLLEVRRNREGVIGQHLAYVLEQELAPQVAVPGRDVRVRGAAGELLGVHGAVGQRGAQVGEHLLCARVSWRVRIVALLHLRHGPIRRVGVRVGVGTQQRERRRPLAKQPRRQHLRDAATDPYADEHHILQPQRFERGA